MKNLIKLIISFMIVPVASHAQVAEHYFTQQNLSYTEIIGGTSLWSVTFDNEVSAAITIPSFTYNGTTYTSLFISANGFVTFGAAPGATNYAPLGSGTFAGAISAFGRDLNQAATGSPEIRYEQVGDEFVIQWKDVRRKNIASEIISFQIRLNTITNHVQVVYGGTITPGNSFSFPQVGIRGTTTSDFNNRTIADVGGNWINSTAGIANNITMYFHSANPGTVPTAGLTYTWKPLYDPLNFTATINGFSQIDLAWQKNSLNHDVMLAYNTADVFGTPASGATYAADDEIPGGGTVLLYGDATSFDHTSVDPTIIYYYKIWSYDEEPDYSPGDTASQFIAYPLPYLQDFPASLLPARWTTNMSLPTNHGIAGTRGLSKRLYSGATTSNATSPLIGNITASTNLSFNYRFVAYDEFPLLPQPLGPNDKIDIQVSLDGGSNFTTIHTIDQNNHTTGTEFTNKMLSLAAYENQLIKIKFLCTWGSGDYYPNIDNVLFEDGTNMSYSGSTAEQPNKSNVALNSTDNEIIRLQVFTQKNSNPLSVTSITFNTTGSTNAGTDLANAKVFYTTTPVFSTGAQFGTTLSSPSGTFTINGTQELTQGNNYFWLAYDIKSTATAGNVVDAQCTQFVTSESGTSKVPTATNPAGTRKVGAIISGIKAIPSDYATIAAAVTALNNGVIGPGGVTFNIDTGHTETSSNITLSATGTVSDPIIFQKSGEGANPLITAAAGTSSYDGIIEIAGGDYITFDGIDLQDPATNITANQRMEWGYALVKMQNTAPVNGCQYVTIRNCNITLQKAHSSSAGIYAGNHIATTTTGLPVIFITDAMNHCRFYGNTISNVYTGIKLSGFNDGSPYDLYNQGNEIGVSGGNTITDFGGSSSIAYGIYTIYESGLEVANNTINGGTGTTGALYGIYIGTATSASTDIYENSVTVAGGASNQIVAGINNVSGSTAAGNIINIYNNEVINCTYSTATSGSFSGIINYGTAATVNIYGNDISNNTLPGSGLLAGIDGGDPANLNIYQNTIIDNQKTGSGGIILIYIYVNAATNTVNINDNEISNNTLEGTGEFVGIEGGSPANLNIYQNMINGNQKTGASGNMLLTSAGSSIVNFHDNDIFDNSFTNSSGASACVIYGYYNIENAPVENIYNNNIYNLAVSGTNTGTSSYIYGIYSSTYVSTIKSIYQNHIYGLSALSGFVYGIYQDLGTTVSIYKNNIHDLSTSSSAATAGIATGIHVNSGAAVYIYNNAVSDLRAPSSTGVDGVRGMAISSAQANSTIGVYFNTIYLNATSSAVNFGSSGIYHFSSSTATTAALDLRNNIIINNSIQKGSSYNTAFRRNSATLNNYQSSSNNNIFYAGAPGTYNVIYHSGVARQTIEDYRAHVGPNRDSISFSEIPPFEEIAMTPYDLHIQDGFITYCESGGEPITIPVAITEDYDGATRPGTPDIGYDEFSGTSAYVEAPLALSASVLNSQQIELDYAPNPDTDDVVFVYNTTGIFTPPTGTPVEGQTLAGGTVAYVGAVSPFIHSGLAPGIPVYYKMFCYNGNNYSFGLSASATPTVLPVTNLTAMHNGQAIIDLGWIKNVLEMDVLVADHSATMNGNPVNGTAYNVGDPIPSGGAVIYKGPASAFSHTGLDSWSQHYYKIWSFDIYNYYSTGATTDAITDADPVTNFPYLQDFEGTWEHNPQAPQNWQIVNVGGGSFTWVRYSGYYHSLYYSARGYGSGACNDYLISPPLQLPDTNLRLSWWDKVTNAASNNSYKILLSTTDNNISSFTTELGDINCTNTAWVQQTIDLSSYKGQEVYIAFHHYYSQSTSHFFTLDDILIETLIPGAATLVSPVDELLTFPVVKLTWAAPLSSEPLSGYKVYLGTDPNPTTLVYDGPELSFDPAGLAHSMTYYWKVLPYNTYGEAMNAPLRSFSTVTATQLAESFEAENFPPISWTFDYGWFNASSSVNHGLLSASTYTYIPDYQFKLITPLLNISTGDKLEFFETTASSTYQRIQIKYSSDKVVWINFGDSIAVTVADWGFHSIDLSTLAGNNYYLAFAAYYDNGGSSRYIYLDHVTGPDIVPVLPAPASNPMPFDTEEFVSTEPILSWDPLGHLGIPAGYKVYLDENLDPVTLIYNGTEQTCLAGALDYNTTYYWKVVPHNVVGDAEDCPVWSFTTVPEGGVQIGREFNDYLGLPVYTYYGYNYSQSLYLQSEIDISGKRIDRLYFHWNGMEEGTACKDWIIYMGHTSKTEFTSDTDWVPISQMTAVFDGEVYLPNYAGWVEIFLDLPFEYNNLDNLVIAVDENTPGYSYSGNFYSTDVTTTRSMIFYDDGIDPDPASPPAAYDLVSGIPNMRLILEDFPTGPEFRVSPTSRDFGAVNIQNSSNPQVFKIKNKGIGSLTILNVDMSGLDDYQFQFTDTNSYPVVLNENEFIVVSAAFTPSAEGYKSASLIITDNISGFNQVPLFGYCYDLRIHNFPFEETFEDYSTTRDSWFQYVESGYYGWGYATGNWASIDTAHGGLLNAGFYGYYGDITKFATPFLNLTGVVDPSVRFWYANEISDGNINQIRVYYRISPFDPWVEIFYDDADVSQWTEVELSLPNPSDNYQVAFEVSYLDGQTTVIDEVRIGPPDGLSTTWLGGISSNWTDPGNWSDGVPGLSHSVLILPGTFIPDIDINVVVFSISIATGANINIAPSGSLTVTGN